MAAGNYGGRISPRPMSKLNLKCTVAAAWATLLTSGGFAHALVRTFCLSLLPHYLDRKVGLYKNLSHSVLVGLEKDAKSLLAKIFFKKERLTPKAWKKNRNKKQMRERKKIKTQKNVFIMIT